MAALARELECSKRVDFDSNNSLEDPSFYTSGHHSLKEKHSFRLAVEDFLEKKLYYDLFDYDFSEA